MADPGKAFGFEYHDGPKVIRRVNLIAANAAIGIGDMLNMTATGEVDRAAAGDVALFGVSLDPAGASNGGDISCIYCLPGTQFRVRSNGTIAQTDIGNLADIVVAARDSNTLKSNMELNQSGLGTGAANLKLLDLWRQQGNDYGDTTPVVIVSVHETHHGSAATTGV